MTPEIPSENRQMPTDRKDGLPTLERPTPRAIAARALAATASLVVAAGLVTATGVTAASAARSKHVKHGPAPQCTAVSDVLADGPTLTADPVGYAEAQVLPLKQLKLSYPPLKQAVAQLDAAYKAYSSSNGSSKAAVKVTVAQDRVNAICPTAAP